MSLSAQNLTLELHSPDLLFPHLLTLKFPHIDARPCNFCGQNVTNQGPLKALPPEVRRHLLTMMELNGLRTLVHASSIYHEICPPHFSIPNTQTSDLENTRDHGRAAGTFVAAGGTKAMIVRTLQPDQLRRALRETSGMHRQVSKDTSSPNVAPEKLTPDGSASEKPSQQKLNKRDLWKEVFDRLNHSQQQRLAENGVSTTAAINQLIDDATAKFEEWKKGGLQIHQKKRGCRKQALRRQTLEV